MKKTKEILAEDIWAKNKAQELKDFILTHSNKQSKERKLRNELLAIQYQIEDYIENNDYKTRLRVLDFV